jgi:succinate-acetate transporter protein
MSIADCIYATSAPGTAAATTLENIFEFTAISKSATYWMFYVSMSISFQANILRYKRIRNPMDSAVTPHIPSNGLHFS